MGHTPNKIKQHPLKPLVVTFLYSTFKTTELLGSLICINFS